MDKDCSDIHNIEQVSQCPQNEKDTIFAALIKSCTPNKPICCKPEEFNYHCLLSGDGRGYYEFCACTKRMSYCAEVNLLGQQIQTNFHAICRPGILTSACGRSYNSSEAYEVSECYKQVSPFAKHFTRPTFNRTINDLYGKHPMQITMHDTQTDSENANDTANLMDIIMRKFSQDIRKPKEESLYTTVRATITESLNTTTTLGNDNSASIDDNDQSMYHIIIGVCITVIVIACVIVFFWRKKGKRIDRRSVNTRNGEEIFPLEMHE